MLGVNGRADYPVLTQAAREWDAGAPQRAVERARGKPFGRSGWTSLIRSLVREVRPGGWPPTLCRGKGANGFSPEEVRQRSMERSEAADYAEAVANLELIAKRWSPWMRSATLRLDAVGLEEARSYLKEVSQGAWVPWR